MYHRHLQAPARLAPPAKLVYRAGPKDLIPIAQKRHSVVGSFYQLQARGLDFNEIKAPYRGNYFPRITQGSTSWYLGNSRYAHAFLRKAQEHVLAICRSMNDKLVNDIPLSQSDKRVLTRVWWLLKPDPGLKPCKLLHVSYPHLFIMNRRVTRRRRAQ